MTEASLLSLLMSSSTFSTITPAFRVAGSFTCSTTFLGVRSTPRESASMVSNGFFFACDYAMHDKNHTHHIPRKQQQRILRTQLVDGVEFRSIHYLHDV